MGYLQIINTLNNAVLQHCRPLIVEQQCVGWVWQENIARLQRWGIALQEEKNNWVWQAPADFAARNAILANAAKSMLAEQYIAGWRAELLPIKSTFSAPPVALIERAAAAVLGIKGYGVHLNGLTHKEGKLHMWLARRSLQKAVEPGKLDQIVAGGIPDGFSVLANLCKESSEEANIPTAWLSQAKAVGLISYREQLANGVRNDVIFNYDLVLPPDFCPQNTDGEVAEFLCLPLKDVADWLLSEPTAFKRNSAVVLIDFFLRYGVITPDHPNYEEICTALRINFS